VQQGAEVRGRPAAAGIFIGPVVAVEQVVSVRTNSGEPAREAADLVAAVERAIADIGHLAAGADGEAADILGFQIAMLEDDALRAPALADIAKGLAAGDAWAKSLDAEVIGYELSDDEYFRARAADLKDIRDRVLRNLAGFAATLTRGGAILAGRDVPPTLFLETDWSKGGAIALSGGSATSHVAMLARARGVPMVVGLGDNGLEAAREAVVDGGQGLVILQPGEAEKVEWRQRIASDQQRRQQLDRARLAPARLANGRPIAVQINVTGTDELAFIDPASCDGIGLMRSEFLFRDGAPLPDEEQQYRAYRRFLEWAGGKPVTIRTLDIGGDKPVRGLTPEGESNPFLGTRGIRLMLSRPDVFRLQLRALARATVHGNLKVMLPMVSVPEEIDQAAALLDACLVELESEGKPCARPPLGIMVEVPAVAVTPERFTRAAFFSIGSNDLTQYVMAASRDEGGVSGLNDPLNPAVLKLIAGVVQYAAERGTPVSICGEMAGDVNCLPALMATGISTLSVAPSAIGPVKSALAGI